MKNQIKHESLKGYSRKSAGLVIQSLRLANNFTQSEFANLIQISQGNVSKIENGDLSISLESWLEIERRFRVHPLTLEKQYIDELTKKNGKLLNPNSSNGYSLKKRYLGNYITTIRGILPLLNVCATHPNFFEKLLKKYRLKRSFFYDFNNPVNFNLIKDLLSVDEDILKKTSKSIFMNEPSPYMFGDLHFKYNKISTATGLFSSFIKHLNSYCFDFHREIISTTESSIVIESVKKSDCTLEDAIKDYYSLLYSFTSKYLSAHCQIKAEKFANGTIVHQVNISDH